MQFLNGLLTKSAAGSPEDAQTLARVTGGSSGAHGGKGFMLGGWGSDKAITQGYERSLWVFRCVDAIASAQCKLPIKEVKGSGPDPEEMKNDVLWRILNKRANKYEVARQLRYRMDVLGQLSTTGVKIEVVPSDNGDIAELHIMPLDTEAVPGDFTKKPDGSKVQAEFVKHFLVRGADNELYEMPVFSKQMLTDRKRSVLWLMAGKPMPNDPYRQMTPMMVAGLAVETDFLARIFNRNFMANDGRPGMIVNVRGRLSREDAQELGRYFSGGVSTAGQTRVIEADDISVVDMSATPRDAQWLETLRGSKEDILAAFGVSETFLGMAAGRTFDNADAENEITWQTTEVDHCDGIASGLDPLTLDVNDDQYLAFDYSGVDVLQRQIRRRHDKAIEEWSMGVTTWNEMREAIGKATWSVPLGARVIFLPSGIAFGETDQDTAGVADLAQIQPPPQPDPGAALSEAARSGATKGAIEGNRVFLNAVSARAIRIAGKVALQGQRETKALPAGRVVIEGTTADEDDGEPHRDREEKTAKQRRTHPYSGLRTRLESEITATLSSWSRRQARTIEARITGPKSVKHTRHWVGDEEFVGEKALNPLSIMDPAKWAADIRADVAEVIRPFAQEAAEQAALQLRKKGVLKDMNLAHQASALHQLTGSHNFLVDDVMGKVLDLVEESSQKQSQRITAAISDLDREGKSIAEIKQEVADMITSRQSWYNGLAVAATTSAIEGATSAVLDHVPTYVTRKWQTEDDEKVRPTHEKAEGQKVKGSAPFTVGGFKMKHPGDLTAPVQETAGCRCWTSWDAVVPTAGSAR